MAGIVIAVALRGLKLTSSLYFDGFESEPKKDVSKNFMRIDKNEYFEDR